jgi:tight adherence protein B
MNTLSQNFASYLPIVSMFGLILTLWIGGMVAVAMRRAARGTKIGARLGFAEEGGEPTRVLRLWYEGREVTTEVTDRNKGLSFTAKLAGFLRSAGIEAPLQSVALGMIGVSSLVFLLAFVFAERLFASFGAVAGLLLITWIILKQRIGRRLATFEAQFIDALELASRSLRAGHPLIGAFRLISDEVPAPVGTLFGSICQRQDLGVSLQAAVRDAALSHGNDDLRLFSTSIAIQLRSGGNLADMMNRLAAVIRERTKLKRRFQTLVAQTQLSKRILVALPILLFVIMNLINPQYMEPLFVTTLGQRLLMGACVSLLLGVWAMNRMVVLRY